MIMDEQYKAYNFCIIYMKIMSGDKEVKTMIRRLRANLDGIHNNNVTIVSRTEGIANRLSSLDNRFNSLIVRYPIEYILQYLDQTDITKNVIVKYFVKGISIYNKNNGSNLGTFSVCYDYGLSTYQFTIKYINGIIKLWQPTITVTENDSEYATYDIEKEFRSFNYLKLHRQGFLDNYINFTVKRDCIKLGMTIFIYFYVIKYKRYSIHGLLSSIDTFRAKSNIQVLERLFDVTVDDVLGS